MSTTALASTTKNAAYSTVPMIIGRSRVCSARVGEPADPGQPENHLGEQRRAADERAEVQPEQRHDRDHRAAQRVPDEHAAFGDALGAGGPHVVLVHRGQHLPAQQPCVDPGVQDGEGEPGEQQVQRPLRRVVGEADVAERRHPGEDPSCRRLWVTRLTTSPIQYTGSEMPSTPTSMISGSTNVPRRAAATAPMSDSGHHPDDRRAEHQRQRDRHGARDLRDDLRAAVDERLKVPADEQVPHHQQVPDRHRPVQPERVPHLRPASPGRRCGPRCARPGRRRAWRRRSGRRAR